jgi:esterase/lipase
LRLAQGNLAEYASLEENIIRMSSNINKEKEAYKIKNIKKYKDEGENINDKGNKENKEERLFKKRKKKDI